MRIAACLYNNIVISVYTDINKIQFFFVRRNMQYRSYGKLGYKVSALGLGCMRLPRIYNGQEKASVNLEAAFDLIRYAADNGVTYFDTAWGYHNQTSESILGEALAGGRREKVKIATKQPLAAMTTRTAIRENLENTLKKLRTDYLDVYLIHNIQPANWEEIKTRKIIAEYEKFRDEGLIKAIGFSYHGNADCFKDVLAYYSWDMCQIQQNFIDIEREATAEAITLAGKKGCALVIMEPLRGGGLAIAPPSVKALYDDFPVKRSPVEWAFRHLINYPEVSTVLSGMTTPEQLKENIEIFSRPDAVPGCVDIKEKQLLRKVKTQYESLASVPCTGCEYCMPCPGGVNIPAIFSRYNEGVMFQNFAQPQRSYMFLGRQGHDAAKCATCGACEEKCPQHIGIMEKLKVSHEALKGWIE
jgi:predicted aldo/keto reductase-like oxidoreductase